MADNLETETPRREQDTTRQPDPGSNPQGKSPLFACLPPEIRREIFSLVFYNTRVTYGSVYRNGTWSTNIKPAPNSLALLRTCRRAKEEVGDSWLGKILFSFRNPETMLDKLTPLPRETRAKIRYLHVFDETIRLNLQRGVFLFELHLAFRMLPGLRLDILTIQGDGKNHFVYDAVTNAVWLSSGWKELRYITRTSGGLGFKKVDYPFVHGQNAKFKYWRQPQPAYWKHFMKKRDGAASEPSIAIYRSLKSHSPGTVLDPKMRQLFNQKMPKSESLRQSFGTGVDDKLMAKGERLKEIMIVARRGNGVDYEQKAIGETPFTGLDIAKDILEMPWGAIKWWSLDSSLRMGRSMLHGKVVSTDFATVADSYEDVDSIMWHDWASGYNQYDD